MKYLLSAVLRGIIDIKSTLQSRVRALYAENRNIDKACIPLSFFIETRGDN